jgi:hypothetical protein
MLLLLLFLSNLIHILPLSPFSFLSHSPHLTWVWPALSANLFKSFLSCLLLFEPVFSSSSALTVLGEASIGFVLLYHLSRQTGAALIHSKFHYKLNEIRAKTKQFLKTLTIQLVYLRRCTYVVSLKRRGLPIHFSTYIYLCVFTYYRCL